MRTPTRSPRIPALSPTAILRAVAAELRARGEHEKAALREAAAAQIEARDAEWAGILAGSQATRGAAS